MLLPENWRFEVVSKEIFDHQVVAEVRPFIRIADEWLSKGSQTGQMQIVRANMGDAYRGLLREVYFSGGKTEDSTARTPRPRPAKDRRYRVPAP